MARFLIYIALALVVALVLRARPVVALAVALATWIALPAVAAQMVTGETSGPLAAHPATVLVLAVFVVQLLFRPAPIARMVAQYPLLVVCAVVMVAGSLWTSIANNSGGLKLLLDQILAPILVFVLLVASAQGNRRDVNIVRNTVLVLAALESVLTMVQAGAGRMLVYEAYYETLPWFRPLRFDRWMGTTDSPLILAYLLCIAAALAVGLERVWLRLSLIGLFLVSALITQSRTGVAVICGVILFTVLRSRMAIWARGLASVAVVAAGYILLTSTLVVGFASRLADDTGSADARQRALVFIFGNWASFLFAGQGLTASYTVARGAGLQTSIESSILMYAVDVGWALTVIYFGAQLGLILRNGFHHRLPGATMAALIAFGLPQLSSALAWSNLSGMLLWWTLALLVLARTLVGQPRVLQTSGAPATANFATSSAV